MLVSQLFGTTLREAPKNAETKSHQYLLRGNFIAPLGAGLYTFMPLMVRVLRKISEIVREEMDRAGGLQVTMPIVQPANLWQESGRWERYLNDGIMFHLKDRKDFELCLGPTHEEVVTDLVRQKLQSYRDLPVNLYQIGNKYRDEIRPRFGLIRCREFVMKDAYSFDRDTDGLNVAYEKMHEAYCRIFDRCGLTYRVVQADPGPIGGSASAEFMVLAQTGEDTILECDQCGYAANVEKAEAKLEAASHEDLKPLEAHDTPDIKTVGQLEKFFSLPASRMIKTILYQADEEVVAVLMRGDVDINEVKLANVLKCGKLALADDETVKKATQAEVGFAGPVRLKGVRLLADLTTRDLRNFLCGHNVTDQHCLNVNWERDVPLAEFHDLRKVKEGDECPGCGALLHETKGIEVGHIFKLGTKYSVSMNLTYLDEQNERQPVQMGCYGIGVSRIAAAAIEQNHDDAGIVWPEPIAPFQVIVLPVSRKDETQFGLAKELYDGLNRLGVDTILDDRDERFGAKMADADLVGYPWKIIIGKRAAEGLVDLKPRRTGVVETVPVAEVLARFRGAS